MSADPTSITVPLDHHTGDVLGTDWNWAESATAAWLDAARDAELVIEAEDWEPRHPDIEAARVRIRGTWYALEVAGRTPELRAIPET